MTTPLPHLTRINKCASADTRIYRHGSWPPHHQESFDLWWLSDRFFRDPCSPLQKSISSFGRPDSPNATGMTLSALTSSELRHARVCRRAPPGRGRGGDERMRNMASCGNIFKHVIHARTKTHDLDTTLLTAKALHGKQLGHKDRQWILRMTHHCCRRPHRRPSPS